MNHQTQDEILCPKKAKGGRPSVRGSDCKEVGAPALGVTGHFGRGTWGVGSVPGC